MASERRWWAWGALIVMAGVACDETKPSGNVAAAGEGASESSGGGAGKRSGSGAGQSAALGGADVGLGAAGEPGAEQAAGAGAAGDAGAAGSGPAFPTSVSGLDCNGEAFELDPDIVKRCVVALSCLGPDGGRISYCIQSWSKFTIYHLDVLSPLVLDRPLQVWPHITACAEAKLDNCQDVLACAGQRAVVDECDGDKNTRCEGELAINCLNQEITDCQRTIGEAGACRLVGAVGSPMRAECVAKASCTEAEDTLTCDGDVAYRCDGGVGYGIDCSEFGVGCGMIGDQSICRDTALPTKACAELGQTACAGDVMTYCSNEGLLFESDCGERGLTCTDQGPPDSVPDPAWLDCVVPGCQPDYDVGESCDGDDLKLPLQMAGEAGIVVHCPDYGFATCRYDRCAN